MRILFLLVGMLCTGCPERAVVEHGVQLTYLQDEFAQVRANVDRRLASLKLSARLHEDGRRFTVRSDGRETERIKALLAIAGRFELCGGDDVDAGSDCVSPHVVSAEPRGAQLLVQFDKAGATTLTDLTTRLVGRPFFVRLDAQVLVSATITEPIDHGKLTVPVPAGMDPAVFAAVLVGGPVTGLTFEAEARF